MKNTVTKSAQQTFAFTPPYRVSLIEKIDWYLLYPISADGQGKIEQEGWHSGSITTAVPDAFRLNYVHLFVFGYSVFLPGPAEKGFGAANLCAIKSYLY